MNILYVSGLEYNNRELARQLASANALIAEQNKLAKERQEWALHTNEVIRSLNQQLAGAIAACKQKDEELENIRGHIGLYNLFSCVGSDSYDPECADLNVGKCREIATKALAIQPDDAALKAWIGEPVAYLDANYGFMRCGNAADNLPIGTLFYSPKGINHGN